MSNVNKSVKRNEIAMFRLEDLNGATAEVLIRTSIKDAVDVIECTRENINENLDTFIRTEEFKKYKKVFIIGMSFDKKIAEKIDGLIKEELTEFIYMDHNESSLDLSKYMWTRILLKDGKGNPISSSKNLYRTLVSTESKYYIRLSLLIDMVNASVTGYIPEEDLEGKNTIEELYSLASSSKEFADSMTNKVINKDAFFNEADILAKIEAERIAKEEEQARLEELRRERKRNSSNRGL